ncbi:MAG: SpoIIE family protein phosphatase [Spirochaetes bacterium]|nr:SpoIIE family protein phosphatase [Spirochaetota bacterium]
MHLKKFFRSNIFIGICFVILFAADFFSIVSLADFSSKYPFDRVLYGNTFKYSYIVLGKSDLYDSVLVKMNGVYIDENNAKDVIRNNSEYLSTCQIKKKSGLLDTMILKRSFNYNIFSSAIFFIIIANIHIIWGLIVWKIRLEYKLSYYYALFSVNLGVVLFALSLHFMYERAIYVVILSASFFTGLFLFVFADMINAKRLRLMKAAYLVIAFLLAAVSFFQLYNNVVRTIIVMNTANLVAFVALLILFIVYIFKSCFSLRRILQISLISFAGFVLPCAILLLSNSIDIPVTVFVNTSLTMIIPLTLGNSLIRANGSFKFKVDKIFLGEFSADFFSALLIAFLGVFVFNLYTSGIAISSIFPLAFVAIIILVSLRRGLKRSISTNDYNHDVYISSLRDISVIAAETSELNYKLARIYIEAFRILSLNQMKICVSSERLKNSHKSPFETYVKYFNTNSPLAVHYKKYKSLIKKDSLFAKSLYETLAEDMAEISNYYAVSPITDSETFLGVVLLGEKINGSEFTENDIRFINSFSFLVYQMIENDIMFTDYIDKLSFEQDMDNASFVQMRLFPKTFPSDSGLDIVYYTRPYIKLMGDYFDFFKISENKTAFIIADVTGHGMPAAMIVSVTSMIFNSLMRLNVSLGKVMNELNNFLSSRYAGIELITAFAGIYDKTKNEIEYVNAGHCQPVIYRKTNEPAFIEDRFNMLGVDRSSEYSSKFTPFRKGDFLVLYTDGLTELYDGIRKDIVGNEIFYFQGKERFKSTESLLDAFVGTVDSFEPEMIKDDVTVAVIRCC